MHGDPLSWQAEPSLVQQEVHPTENSHGRCAGGRSTHVFPNQPPKFWELWSSWPPPIQEILALLKSWLFSVMLITRFCFGFRVWVEGRVVKVGTKKAAEWLQFFATTRDFFLSRASTNFWSANYMAIILLKSATTSMYAYRVSQKTKFLIKMKTKLLPCLM